MDMVTFVGSLVVGISLVLISWLTLWSRRKINRLARQNFPSARAAERELADE